MKCYHSPWLALNGCCYILVGLGWSLLFPDGLWIVAVLSWWVLDACCYCLLGPGWLLLFPTVSWMVTVFSLWAMDGYRYFSTTQILARCAQRARTVPGRDGSNWGGGCPSLPPPPVVTRRHDTRHKKTRSQIEPRRVPGGKQDNPSREAFNANHCIRQQTVFFCFLVVHQGSYSL